MTQPLVASTSSLASDDPNDLVYSVCSYLQVLLEEGGELEQLHPAALTVNALNRLDGEVLNGGFSQFVYNTRWNADFNATIAEGLAAVGATDQAAWFTELSAFVDSPEGQAGLTEFFESEYFGENAFRDRLNDDRYFDFQPPLAHHIATWIRHHPDLAPHTIDEMFTRVESLVDHPVARE